METTEQMKTYIEQMHAADKAYYNAGTPILTDYEYDQMFDALKKLEQEAGVILSGSPTHRVSGEVLDELHKVQHTRPMLSADKTKSVDDVIKFIDGRPCVLSWKLDGSTMVLRYENGELRQAITRGDGHAGDDVTHTARVFLDIPIKIKEREKIEVRGEAVISWANFESINEELEDNRYSHPRNLASGSIGMLDARGSKNRCLEFRAFDLVEGPVFPTKAEQLRYMQQLGFHVVEHVLIENMENEQIRRCMDDMDPKSYAYPVDGLIIEQNDVAYGKSLGRTGHHENRMIALKWKDEEYETRFRGVELRPTRKGRLSLTGIFDPVEMDGATVSRATLHNFDMYKRFRLGLGDRVLLIRSNMVIPQLVKNLDCSDTYELPETCPCCGADVVIRKEENTNFLYCSNSHCPGALVQKFVHYCERTRMNIPGLSEATLAKFVLRSGDTLVIQDLDRLSRNKLHINQELRYFQEQKIRVKILNIPTTLIDPPKGQEWVIEMTNNIIIEVYASIAENERKRIRERQQEGIEAARIQGKHLGRPRIPYPVDWDSIYKEWQEGKITAVYAMQKLGLKRSTFYRLVRLSAHEELTEM